MGARHADRIEARHAEGDDLLLEADLEAAERHAGGTAFLVLQQGKRRHVAQFGQEPADFGLGAGDGAVDSLRGQQQCAADPPVFAHPVDRRLQAGETGQVHEPVERRDEEIAGQIGLSSGHRISDNPNGEP